MRHARKGCWALAICLVIGLAGCQFPPGTPGGPAPHEVGRCAPLGASTTEPLRSTPPAQAPTQTVTVDLDHPTGPANRSLTGVVWNAGDSVAPLAGVHPKIVRIDGSLQNRSVGPDQLDLQPLLDRVAQVRAIGAEPLVILSYMPRWLGAARAGTNDPTRYGPYSLDVWQDLVTKVVRTLATAPQPAYKFEVWNEPDIPIFWQDTPEEFVATALRTHRAVAEVKRETGKPLEIGGPAAAFGLNDNMVQYLQSVAHAGLPLDFVSWHKYANSPYLGPDGPEGNLPLDLYQKLAKRNPKTTPLDYANEITAIKTKVAAALTGSNLEPEFIIDEWNVSAGGYDLRHDDAEGASLDAGILIEMERAGLDAAAFYRAVSGSADTPGDWGLVHSDGTPKPAWWVFRAWATLTGQRLALQGDAPDAGLFARATRDTGCISILLTNFVATGAPSRTVRLDLGGQLPHCRGALTTTLATLDQTSHSLATPSLVQVGRRPSMTVAMASQSVALIQLSCP